MLVLRDAAFRIMSRMSRLRNLVEEAMCLARELRDVEVEDAGVREVYLLNCERLEVLGAMAAEILATQYDVLQEGVKTPRTLRTLRVHLDCLSGSASGR